MKLKKKMTTMDLFNNMRNKIKNIIALLLSLLFVYCIGCSKYVKPNQLVSSYYTSESDFEIESYTGTIPVDSPEFKVRLSNIYPIELRSKFEGRQIFGYRLKESRVKSKIIFFFYKNGRLNKFQTYIIQT